MTDWFRPCSGGVCPEIRYVGGRVEIRDSARPAEVAWFRAEAWLEFVDALRSAEDSLEAILRPSVQSGPENPPTAPTAPATGTPGGTA